MYLNILRHTPRLRAIDLNWTLKKKLVWGYRPGWNWMETTQAVNSFRNHIDIPFPKVKRLNTPRYFAFIRETTSVAGCFHQAPVLPLPAPGVYCFHGLIGISKWTFPHPKASFTGDGALHCNSTTRLWDRMSPAAQLCLLLLPSAYFKVTWHRLA